MSLTSLGPEAIAAKLYRSDRVHTPLASLEAIDEKAIEFFRAQGFLAVENVFTRDEVEAAKAGLSHLIAGGNPQFKNCQFENGVDVSGLSGEALENYVRKIMSFCDFDPRLHAIAHHPKMLQIVRRILGSDVKMIQDMALLKPARVGREKPWHQDTAYFLYEPLDGILGTWTALDSATIENGCMHVIPASHLQGPRPHYHDRDCQLADEEVDVDRDVVVPLAPGGVLFFSGLLHHGTPPNRSAARRRALQFHYMSANCRKMESAEHQRYFKEPAGYAGCTGFQTNIPGLPIAKKT
ncbi:MAG TPA: phytanoyl-CoA dioxygenase family protein [Tepidisphaeraceae bacterium]|jgi:phytanoyl-CoA hydroxylase|nr:phytanoyl-CoA dioxygenase family protein [Tepidisphaeraceae bacterium]